ncbi:tyrosine aminotransferase-like [Eriocheir sinensis]|uniref:tyrosine aminotransferase-like n=1 Tax=Eriocheir sinensis TaxID=95602 RepID=UPI0021C92D11|nr:tyrosine aminotransferase-like [Eriocheir sinensis]
MRDRKSWNVPSSTFAKNTFNPIRNIVENLQIVPHPDKPMIALSIGDPTVFGNLKPAPEVIEAVVEATRKGSCNGYVSSTGMEDARSAVAKYCRVEGKVELSPKDVILCSGCSCALDLCITALCGPGQTLLVPRPGFPIYRTLAEGLGVVVKDYNLLPERNWEVDLEMLEACIDEQTAAIVVNNPSNPCGSVYTRAHLLGILEVAARNKVPIIADEIYDHFVFEGQEYHAIASLTDEVPVLSCGGLTKRFLVPGWRMGWITINDRNNVFEQEVRKGLQSLSQRIIGSNTLVQGALPSILANTPPSFFTDTLTVIQANAEMSYSVLREVPGLCPVMPQGAMYMMVGVEMASFPALKNDLDFVERLISEESVFCLPGKCFDFPNYVRIVLTVPDQQLREACNRIADFCARHHASAHALAHAHTNGHVNGSVCEAEAFNNKVEKALVVEVESVSE